MPDDASLGRSLPEDAFAATDAKSLIDLAERMGIPAAAAIRQVGELIAEVDGYRHRAPRPAGQRELPPTNP